MLIPIMIPINHRYQGILKRMFFLGIVCFRLVLLVDFEFIDFGGVWFGCEGIYGFPCLRPIFLLLYFPDLIAFNNPLDQS